MNDLLHQPGFFGTSANFAADMTLAISIFVAALFTYGLILARQGKYEKHRWIQTAAAILNAILVFWLMVLPFRDFIAPGLPNRLNERFYWITTLHGVVGFSGLTLGLFVVLRGNELVPKFLKFNNYPLFMRLSYGLYMLATLIGIGVYLVWFVNNPNPPVYN